MAPGDRLPLLLLLLLWTVTSSVLSSGPDGGPEYSVCNTRCCRVEPNCSAALHVTCRCDSEPRVAFRRGDFPASVESIEIYGMREFTIYEDAFLDLTSLAKVELWRVKTLTIHANGLALRKNSSLFTLHIGSVKKMTIASSAFSGFWERGTKIKISDVFNMYVEQDAFRFRSSFQKTGLTIEAVRSLDMAFGAFNAPFSYLTLKTAKAELCRRKTFSGNITRMELVKVQIREVREGCISGTGGLNWLSMSNTSLGVIRHRGIQGKIHSVKIHNSRITKIQPNGFQVEVHNLRVTRSYLKSVMIRGLNVLARDSIFMNEVVIDMLHRHALIAMQISGNQTENRTSVHIDGLNIMHAENGSLTFDMSTNLKLRRLSVRAPEHPVCPASRWVRQLTGAKETEPPGPTQRRMLDMLQRDWLCQEIPRAAQAKQTVGDAGDVDPDNLAETLVALFLVLVIIAGIALIWYKSRVTEKGGKQQKGEHLSRGGPSQSSEEMSCCVTVDGLKKRRKTKPIEKTGETRGEDKSGDEGWVLTWPRLWWRPPRVVWPRSDVAEESTTTTSTSGTAPGGREGVRRRRGRAGPAI